MTAPAIRYRLTRSRVGATEALVEAGAYGYAHSCVTSENFPVRARRADEPARDVVLLAFGRDVAAMSGLVQEAGLPPVIGIVFNQFPGGDPRGWGLVEVAERAMADAGFDVISVMSWRERFKDRVFPVSRWEMHPNELAHSLIAEELDRRLLARDELRPYAVARLDASA